MYLNVIRNDRYNFEFESMNLAIDQGNSSTKLGFFDKGKLIASYKLFFLDQQKLYELCRRHSPDKVILSSVTQETKILEQFFSAGETRFIIFDHNTPLPFINQYQTPETLGKDRLAAIAGAQGYYPGSTLLVIDAGTAITFDLLVGNTFAGGNISPGIQMRFTALHTQTKQLPKVEPGQSEFWGRTTEEAIRSGVQNGIIMEVDSYIDNTRKQYPDVKTIITGGDADFFVTYTKNIIFVHPNLVLHGLNRILEYNV
jgi:type III pantothenate kinase